MRIEVLAEDRSGLPVIEKILRDELKGEGDELSLHAHKGKGFLNPELSLPEKPLRGKAGLLDLLPLKLRAYQNLPQTMELLLVLVLDSDADDPDALYQRIEACIRRLCPRYYFVIGISIEEIESWILGDWQAISKAYPDANYRLWKRYRQDSVCGTWEKLAGILEGKEKARQLIDLGYPAVGIYKAEWAQNISPYIKAERNQSPSLQKFLERFRQIYRLAKKRDGLSS